MRGGGGEEATREGGAVYEGCIPCTSNAEGGVKSCQGLRTYVCNLSMIHYTLLHELLHLQRKTRANLGDAQGEVGKGAWGQP